MDIPHIPTDNLYKFLALFGIVVIAASTILPPYFHRQVQIQKVQADTALYVAQDRMNVIHQINLAMDNKMDYVEFTRTLAELTPDVTAAKGKQKETELLVQQSLYLLRLAKWGIVIGSFISLLGFVLWYCRLQRWQDISQQKAASIPPPQEPSS